MTPPSDGRRAAFRAAAATALAALAAAAAGLPLAAPGLVEEWSFRWAFDRGQPWIAPDVLASMPTRPLAAVPYALGRALAPDSFAGEKVVLLALLALTALAAAALLVRLVPDPVAAAGGAALAALAPADTSLFHARDLPHHAAVALTLGAILLLARAVERPRPARVAAMAACAAGALLVYESPLLVLLAAPALVPLLADGRRPPRAVVAVWYAVPAAFLVRWAAIALRGSDYTAKLFAAGAESLPERTLATLRAAARMGAAELAAPFDAGGRAWGALAPGDAAAAALAGAAALALTWRASAERPVFPAGRTFLAGFVLLVLGVLPFAVAPALRHEDRRVHLLGSVGAAVVLTAALGVLRPRALRAAFGIAVLVLGVWAGQARRAEASETSRRVGRLVRSLAEGAPSPPAGTVLLLVDADGPPRTEDVLGLTVTDVHLADALRVVHRREELLVYVFGRHLRFRWNGTPEARENGVTVRGSDGSSSLVPWERVAVFREDAGGRVTRLDELPRDAFPFPRPEGLGRLVPRAGPPPPRLETLCPGLSGMPGRAPSRQPAGAGGPV